MEHGRLHYITLREARYVNLLVRVFGLLKFPSPLQLDLNRFVQFFNLNLKSFEL